MVNDMDLCIYDYLELVAKGMKNFTIMSFYACERLSDDA